MRRIGAAAISLSVVAGLIVGAVLATETWSRDPIPPSQERDEREVVVTREDPSLPDGCGVRETTETLLSFTEGFSQGDLAAVDDAFSEADSFFYVGIAHPHGLTGETEAPVDRVAVMAYLESRMARSESYRLTSLMLDAEIKPRDPQARAGVRVHFVVTRRAEDIDSSLVFRGWAQLDCPAGDIYLMELWPLHPSEDIESWCSDSDSDENAVIACSPEPGGKKSLIFPVLDLNPGEEAGLGGRLVRRGRCLYVRSEKSGELGFPIWPPGFTHDVSGGVVTVRDGTGAPVARTGSRVTMAGGFHGEKPVGVPLFTLKDEWEPCTIPASYYFTVSYVVDEDDADQ